MQAISNDSSPNVAQLVCTSCKARKRKCDKILPKCSTCSKKKLKCEYLQPIQESHSPHTNQLWDGFSIVDESHNDSQSIDFPTMLFLDPGILQHGQVEIYQPNFRIPGHLLRLLGDVDDIRNIASKFFRHVHLWMPFISKKRFYDIYLPSHSQNRPDVTLLFLSLKLITRSPSRDLQNPRIRLYRATKHLLLEVEVSTSLSILVLQAGVLLALYELGHGIYPAAFLTIGACARYAHALGIKTKATTSSRRVLTLVEVEERRRVWWALVILDRFVSIGCPGRPFATEDPAWDDLLPIDDEAWNQGIVRPEDYFTLSAPRAGHMSKFSLLCQAARLLGQVLNRLSINSIDHNDDWIQLERTIQSMLAASLDSKQPDNDQIAFIYSTLVALHTPWLSPGPDMATVNAERCNRAKEVIQQIMHKVKANLVAQKCFLHRDPDDMSPWGLFFAYRLCVDHIRSGKGTSDPDSSEVIKSLRETFATINARWNVAGVYLKLLEAQEAMLVN